jgi:hypothetical protein
MAKSAQDRRVYTPSTHGAVCDRRPGHSSYRTVRGVDRPDHPRPIAWPAPWPWPPSGGHRRRGGLFGRRPGAAALQRRTPLAAGRALPVGHLFPRLLSQPVYNRRLRATAWLLEAALRWLADHTPATTELLRLLDGTPVVCGRSRTTAVRSDLAGWAGYGHDTSHHCFYWGSRLLLVTTPDGTVTGFGLANPKLMGEREAVVGMLAMVPANRPAPGTLLVGDKGFAGRDFQAALASLDLAIVRPARAGELDPGSFPNWLRQRVEAIIWTLKHQLGLDRHGGRIPAGLWTRVVQRLLALNAVVWFNWQIDAPVKRSLIAYDH